MLVKQTNETETSCYQWIQETALVHITPKLYKIEHHRIWMENLVNESDWIMDIKLGTRMWDDHSPVEKKQRQMQKIAVMQHLGFKISGYKTDRLQRRVFEIQETQEIFQDFCRGMESETRECLLVIKSTLESIDLSSYGVSLLLIRNQSMRAKLIDFAHTQPGKTDHEYVFGLENLISLLGFSTRQEP